MKKPWQRPNALLPERRKKPLRPRLLLTKLWRLNALLPLSVWLCKRRLLNGLQPRSWRLSVRPPKGQLLSALQQSEQRLKKPEPQRLRRPKTDRFNTRAQPIKNALRWLWANLGRPQAKH
jgi:hypothetical protein